MDTYTDSMKKVLMVLLYLKNKYEMLTRLRKTQKERLFVEIAINYPRKKYKLKFSTWSLRVLAGYIMEEKKLVGRKNQLY